MNDLQEEVFIRAVLQKFDRINLKQDIILEQLSAISKVLAEEFGLAIEEGVVEKDDLN